MQIRSNTIGKLRKIREGSVFTTKTGFILEFLQNSARAKAKRVDITVDRENNLIKFLDNGVGCSNPNNIFTLDSSSWSTGVTEGFGIGFWSCIAYPVTKIETRSRNWKVTMDVNKIFKDNDLSLNKEVLDSNLKGFETIMHCDKNSEDVCYDSVIKELKDSAALQDFDTYINGEYVEKVDALELMPNESDYYEYVENSLFTGIIGLTLNSSNVDIYYEGRYVDNIYVDNGICGVLKMKKNALTYKEPDRRAIIMNTKYFKLRSKIRSIAKKVCKKYVSHMNAEDLGLYASCISDMLNVRDYKKLLRLDNLVVLGNNNSESDSDSKSCADIISSRLMKEEMSRRSEFTHTICEDLCVKETTSDIIKNSTFYIADEDANNNSSNQIAMNFLNNNDNNNCSTSERQLHNIPDTMENVVKFTDCITESGNSAIINPEELSINKEDVIAADIISVSPIAGCSDVATNCSSVKHSPGSSQDIDIKKIKLKFWVKSNDIDVYSDAIAKAQYYGFTILKAPNILYENMFKDANIPYIAEIDKVFQKKNNISNITVKTLKEKRMLDLLEMVRLYYGLKPGTFRIADLGLTIEFVNNGKYLGKTVKKNKGNKIEVCGSTDGEFIYIDRKYLKQHKFNFSRVNKIGSGELRFIMYVLPVISHELAHYLYNTEDNTMKHYQVQELLTEEITQLFVSQIK